MNNKDDSYQDRLKKMKKRLEENQEDFLREFPDDVTHIGDPDLLKKEEHEIEESEKNDSKK